MIETDAQHPEPEGKSHPPPRYFSRSLVRALRLTRLATVSVLGVIALLANSAIAFYALKGVRDSDHVVEQSQKVRRDIHQLRIVMTDAETGQRGFLLTGDEGYLQPY